MSFARLSRNNQIDFVSISPSFSNFQFVDSLLPDGDYSVVRRLFSLARRDNGQTLIIEDIEADGAVTDEITELSALFQSYKCTGLKRLTFWKQQCHSIQGMRELSDEHLLGYAIIKQDCIPEYRLSRWHIFESVFRKFPHEHNCVPCEPIFTLCCGDRQYHLNGVMFCQQNGLNKACAQVALRSLLSRILLDHDIPYSVMNDIARQEEADFVPGEGLSSQQIRNILEYYSIKYNDLDYIAVGSSILPYSKLLYAGIENGLGGLLGFEFSGSGARGEKHIIPFYGHTFNQDTWVPRASLAYFHIGDNTHYISSEEWMSSFIGHDDNFGCNYCVPRRFLDTSQVKYVVALRPTHTEYGAIEAEAIAVDCLYSTINALNPSENYWIRRLIVHIEAQDVVLRTVYIDRSKYVAHLKANQDWNGNDENTDILNVFSEALPEHLWMVEVSIPELFPANYRKLGEIILDAQIPITSLPSRESLWVIARFPGSYLINNNPVSGALSFMNLISAFENHIPLYRNANSNNTI
jgi:hypothetical protein